MLVAWRSSASTRVFGRHAFAVVFDGDELLAAEIHRDGDAARAGVKRVLDQLFDDRCRTLHDLAGGNLIGQRRRQPTNAAHSQSIRLNHHSMVADSTAIPPISHQNCRASDPGRCGIATFMPHTPVSTVSGMKIVAMSVSSFIT